ncbi:MAG: hypothetical protein M0031_15590 [Thermaerobacter sp.]|jgi:hypothetical protein|nr:hypothetical protein [Thermaerobacter sp.]
MAVVAAPEREMALQSLADTVRAVDLQVRDVVLIGSAVYAPDLARDYDLVVTTASSRGDLFVDLYDALNQAANMPVDLILRHLGDKIGNLARAIICGRVLLGEGETIEEARMVYEEGGGAVASFKEAEACLRIGKEDFAAAIRYDDPEMKDRRFRSAFDSLFHGARIAAQTCLGKTETKWGGMARELPGPYGKEFRDFTDTLHIFFYYEGNYPKDLQAVEREFDQWKTRVEDFIEEMRRRTLDRADTDVPER